MMRQHGAIEQKLHWSLAVPFHEERCCLRKDQAAAHRVAWRHRALHRLRQDASRRLRLRQKRLGCGLDEPYVLTVIARATADAITLPLARHPFAGQASDG